LIPTKRFWLLFALGIPIAAIAYLMGQPLLIFAYDALLLIVAVGTYYLAPKTDQLRLRRRFDKVLSVRAQNRIRLEIENDGVEPIRGLLRDEPPPFFEASRKEFSVALEPGRLTELSYMLRPLERGDDSFRGTYLRMQCPLGLIAKDIYLPTEEGVRVYPNVLALREFDLLKQQGRLKEMGIRRARARGLGMDFESLREYGEGDDFRKIDWKASARRGKLVVRQFEQERNQTVFLVIDIGRHMLSEVDGVTKLDHVLDALLMLTHAAAVAGDMVGLLVYSDTVRRYIPPRKGRNQVGMIIEAIHDLLAEPVESDPLAAFSYLQTKWTRRSLMVIFTDYEDEDRARELVTAFKPLARKHLAVIARVLDSRLDEVLSAPIENVKGMYLKSAAALLTKDRVAAKSLVAASGIHNLEAEPQDLAAALVNFYMVVKERSLL
jgi:uncharacterized protein (DUF58 family)